MCFSMYSQIFIAQSNNCHRKPRGDMDISNEESGIVALISDKLQKLFCSRVNYVVHDVPSLNSQ